MQRMKREKRDRGAVAVWVGIMMVPLMIVAALALDVGAMHADRQRLQTGADSAALAIAQQCANGACGDTDATAQELADANEPQGGPVVAQVVELDTSRGYVEVQTSSERGLWFAPVIGQTSAAQTRVGAASWGYPTGGASLPLTFSWCEILHFTGGTVLRDASGAMIGIDIGEGAEDVVLYNKTNKPDINFHPCNDATEVTNYPGGAAPSGGFGWLVEAAGLACTANETSAGGWFDSDTGNDHPDNCSVQDLTAMLGQTIMVPVFDATNSLSGSNADYHIFGYIAFRFEGFYFGHGWSSPTSPCGAPHRCISGDIVGFVDYDSGFDTSPDGPQFGSTLVQLRLPEEG